MNKEGVSINNELELNQNELVRLKKIVDVAQPKLERACAIAFWTFATAAFFVGNGIALATGDRFFFSVSTSFALPMFIMGLALYGNYRNYRLILYLNAQNNPKNSDQCDPQ